MAFCRLIVLRTGKLFNPSFIKNNISQPFIPNLIAVRNIRNAYSRFEKVMKLRRKVAGPDRLRKRSELQEWNYEAEIYAFPKRLHEEISEITLKTAFVHQSYIDKEEETRRKLGVPSQNVSLDLKPNTELALLGGNITSDYIKLFVRHCYKYLPEEGVSAVHDYLMSDDVLSHVSCNIGTSDLILCEEYPPEKSTLSTTLKAVVGAIATDSNQRKAETFVLDFICTQLIGKDVFDMWDIPYPLIVLDDILKLHGWETAESRLVFQSGQNTIEGVFVVAIYSNKVFLGKGTGETVIIAEEMAAFDALRKLFEITGSEAALPFGKKGKEIELDGQEHQSLSEWRSEKLLHGSAETQDML